MPLSDAQVVRLRAAAGSYAFPSVYMDFSRNLQVTCQVMSPVETYIGNQLTSPDLQMVKHGLANVLYWGHARAPYQGDRVGRFLAGVLDDQVRQFQAMTAADPAVSPVSVRDIRMPQFSGMSFVSKILMFLNSDEFCVLDRQITKLRTLHSAKALNDLRFRDGETQIRITAHNSSVYKRWCLECSEISRTYFDGRLRPVDIERALFTIIQNGRATEARTIYNAA